MVQAHAAKAQGDVARSGERAAAPIGFSLLRASVPSRFLFAAAASCVLWLAVWWALT
jgi:hypothetical protein